MGSSRGADACLLGAIAASRSAALGGGLLLAVAASCGGEPEGGKAPPRATDVPSMPTLAPSASARSGDSARSGAPAASGEATPPVGAMVATHWFAGIDGVRAITSTGKTLFAVLQDDRVVGWDGTGARGPAPEPIGGVRSLHAVDEEVCAVTRADEVICRSEPWLARDAAGTLARRDDGWVSIGELTSVVSMTGVDAHFQKSDGESVPGGLWYAVRRDGSVVHWTWSRDAPGADGKREEQPLRVVPGITQATAVAAGEDHACAVLAGGSVRCWHHLLVMASSDDRGPRPEGIEPPLALTDVVGANGACLLRSAGPLTCLARQGTWQEILAHGRRAWLEPRAADVLVARQRSSTSCEVRRGGSLDCAWKALPSFEGIPVVDVDFGMRHSCVLTEGARVYCTLRYRSPD